MNPRPLGRRWRGKTKRAEGVGFEPTVGGHPTAVFKTAALGHYASPPVFALVFHLDLARLNLATRQGVSVSQM